MLTCLFQITFKQQTDLFKGFERARVQTNKQIQRRLLASSCLESKVINRECLCGRKRNSASELSVYALKYAEVTVSARRGAAEETRGRQRFC